ncbi:MAG TPA: alpha/beta hydrolase fold domain-containing protein [Rubrivivax sp.]|nr:alpha/beta hydrolase fold domain-containing protein [Rubrivivax sp.]
MTTASYVHVPGTVSPQAQAFLRTLPDPALKPQFPPAGDIEGWKKLQAWAEADGRAKSEALLKRFEYTMQPSALGGVPVLDVRPKDWTDNGKLLVYTHGGAHVMYSARSMLGRAVVAARTRFAAAAYADPQDQKHPYVSPVYGDFGKGFPPALIQGGLKETLLSGFVRLYQALDAAGVPVKLDLYEGMIHNFQDRMPDAPESALALSKMRAFLRPHLGLAP